MINGGTPLLRPRRALLGQEANGARRGNPTLSLDLLGAGVECAHGHHRPRRRPRLRSSWRASIRPLRVRTCGIRHLCDVREAVLRRARNGSSSPAHRSHARLRRSASWTPSCSASRYTHVAPGDERRGDEQERKREPRLDPEQGYRRGSTDPTECGGGTCDAAQRAGAESGEADPACVVTWGGHRWPRSRPTSVARAVPGSGAAVKRACSSVMLGHPRASCSGRSMRAASSDTLGRTGHRCEPSRIAPLVRSALTRAVAGRRAVRRTSLTPCTRRPMRPYPHRAR